MTTNAAAHAGHKLQVERIVHTLTYHTGRAQDGDLLITPTPTEAESRYIGEAGKTRLYCRDCDLYLDGNWGW